MSNACTIKYGLDTAVSQSEILGALAREKLEAIQTANGLCVKASVAQTKGVLGDLAVHLTIAELTDEERALPDISAFL